MAGADAGVGKELRGPATRPYAACAPGTPDWHLPHFAPHAMFFFFSNKLGWLASIAISLVLTLLLLFLFGVF